MFSLIPAYGFTPRGPVSTIQTTDTGTVEDLLHGRGCQPDLDVVSTPPRLERRCSARRRRCLGVRFGDRRGRDDRSHNTASPSNSHRSRHFRTVLASTWNRSAVAVTDQPRSVIQRIIRRRPSTVRGVFGCRDLPWASLPSSCESVNPQSRSEGSPSLHPGRDNVFGCHS